MDRTQSRGAEGLYREFLQGKERGDSATFEEFCARQPESIRNALRHCHSLAESPSKDAREDREASIPELDRLKQSAVDANRNIGGGPDSINSRSLEDLAVKEGQAIGPYRIITLLGEGGFGTVYLAEREHPFRMRVALKLLKPGMDSRQILLRFEAERQALALMNHPSIAKVLDAGANDRGWPYFAMEHVPGISITKYCDLHHLETRERLRLFRKVCDAVQHAHQRGIIHRDLKPSNILVTAEGETPLPKVIDFGFARALTSPLNQNSIFTEFGQIIGTPEYMSPEQAEMNPLEIDTRTDVYSLGVILYELLCGGLPFDSEALRRGGYASIQRIIREEEPPTPRSRLSRMGQAAVEVANKRDADPGMLARSLRGDLETIIQKAMEKDRTRRYPTASELGADIGRYLAHEPIAARPASFLYFLRKWLHKHPASSSAAAALILLSIALPILFQRLSGQREWAHRVAASAAQENEAREAWKSYPTWKEKVRSLESLLEKAENEVPGWIPVWERTGEVDLWKNLTAARRALEECFQEATLSAHRAIELSPPDSPERERSSALLSDLYLSRYRELDLGEPEMVFPDRYRRLLEAYGQESHLRTLRAGGRLLIGSDPPGARVYCFRYREIEEEGRLVPLPFRPQNEGESPGGEFLAEPGVEVERLLRKEVGPFRPGDRFLRVRGHRVATPSDLARALDGTGEDESVPVEVQREGGILSQEWTPFPKERVAWAKQVGLADRPGLLRDIPRQLGISLSVFPLSWNEGCFLGTTKVDSTIEVELPRGSYLLVFRHPDRVDARFPTSIPALNSRVQVRLFGKGQIPPDFILVPVGSISPGGDPLAFQPLKKIEADIADFFIARCEVTIGEWDEFINDPEVLRRTDDEGRAKSVVVGVRQELEKAGEERVKIVTFPKMDPNIWTMGEGKRRWELAPEASRAWPVFMVSQLAAIEYANWRSEKEKRPWRYRLPTDLEWEKAARGADGRSFVWGNRLIWTHCLSERGSLFKVPEATATHPFDESVYGVKDLEGSVCEHTSGLTMEQIRFGHYRYASVRGGSWDITDEQPFHLANRVGLNPESFKKPNGVRLVAELKP